MDIEMIVLEQDMNVICSLADYYYKEYMIMENSIYMESGEARKSIGQKIKDAGKKLWQLFINALKKFQRWFHKKTKYRHMMKLLNKATPKEMKKFEEDFKHIDDVLENIEKIMHSFNPEDNLSIDNLRRFNDDLMSLNNSDSARYFDHK